MTHVTLLRRHLAQSVKIFDSAIFFYLDVKRYRAIVFTSLRRHRDARRGQKALSANEVQSVICH